MVHHYFPNITWDDKPVILAPFPQLDPPAVHQLAVGANLLGLWRDARHLAAGADGME